MLELHRVHVDDFVFLFLPTALFIRADSLAMSINPIASTRYLAFFSLVDDCRGVHIIKVVDNFLGKSHLTEQLLEVAHHDGSQFTLESLIPVDQDIDVVLISPSVVELGELLCRGQGLLAIALLVLRLLLCLQTRHLESLLFIAAVVLD